MSEFVRVGQLKIPQRFIFLSPLLTVMVWVGALLMAAIIGLAVVVFQQVELSQRVLGFSFSVVNRPFSQLFRETLLVTLLVAEYENGEDIAPLQQRFDVLVSRWEVLGWESVHASFPPDVDRQVAEFTPKWVAIQEHWLLWIANPDDEALRTQLVEALRDFEFDVFQTDVDYQSTRGVSINDSTRASQRLVITLLVVMGGFMAFLILAGFTINSFIVAQRRSDERVQEALAAEAAAQESNRLKDQFIAVMSHELRTPMNAIIGMQGIALMNPALDTDTASLIQRAQNNAKRLLTLINNILDVTRLESGRYTVVKDRVNLRELVATWKAQIEVLAQAKQLAFTIAVEESLPTEVMTDAEALTKIMVNLLGNAVKFTDQGKVELTVYQQQDRLCFRVVDTGIGIPAEMREAIFERFQQVDGSQSRRFGGSGLGLAIVRQFVEVLNGRVYLESIVEGGSVFQVELPLERPA
ncbi:MAG: sensor histidine kinase [Phototrophicaceae bacterium]